MSELFNIGKETLRYYDSINLLPNPIRNDGISPILKKIKDVDGIILGSPIYLASITGEVRSFTERLIFPYIVYDGNYSSLFNKRISVGLIYTFGVNEQRLEQTKWKEHFKNNEIIVEKILGKAESLL